MGDIKVTSVVSGALFGSGLMSAGVYSPHIIIGQMNLENFHMLKVFLAASASSAIAIYIFRKYSSTTCNPKTPETLGMYGQYDGNIIGGALIGAGMAMTGACPGTLLPQLAVGVPSGQYVLTGGLVGGILYSKLRNEVGGMPGRKSKERLRSSVSMAQPTVYQRMGYSEGTGVIAFTAMCLTVIAATGYFFPGYGKMVLPAAVGGFCIGLSQVTSLVLTGNTLGVSIAYENFGELFWWFFSSFSESKRLPNYSAIGFPLGSIIGAWVFSKLIDIPPAVAVDVGAGKAMLGGMMLIIGGRVAGGCTSGHGISGMSMLSTASVVSVASMFGTGIVVGMLIR